MTQSAVVNSSSLGDRWDATFHIALAHLADRITELQDMMTREEAVKKLEGLSPRDKAPLSILVRGQANKLGAAQIDRAVEEYPHLALAIVESNLAPAIERIRAEIARNEKALEKLLDIAEAAPTATAKP
mgnify:CR=1 FL=1